VPFNRATDNLFQPELVRKASLHVHLSVLEAIEVMRESVKLCAAEANSQIDDDALKEIASSSYECQSWSGDVS
jgi:hypothetical protein